MLESVVNLLPSPSEKDSIEGYDSKSNKKIYRFPNSKDKLWAFAFKVVADPAKGLITFFRVYSGTLKNRAMIKNSKTGEINKITQLFRMTADETTNIDKIGVGDIGAIMGWDFFRSGDTIIQDNDNESIILPGVNIPPPVFFCSIHPELSRDKIQLERVLRNLSFEDPSISIKESEETGQTQISGMGELHLEILRDRIKIDYGIEAELGNMRVAYRESVNSKKTFNFKLEKTMGRNQYYAEITLSIEPDGTAEQIQNIENEDDLEIQNLSNMTQKDSSTEYSTEGYNKISYDYLNLEKFIERTKIEEVENLKINRSNKSEDYEVLRSLDSLPPEYLEAIEISINDALDGGVLLGYPIINTIVRIEDGRWSSIRSDEQSFRECASKWIRELLNISSNKLLEPFMSTQIEVPSNCVGEILSSISGKKGGKIISINNVKAKFTDEIDLDKRIIKCLVPLSEIVGYSKYLRSLTKGEGKFIMAFSHFEPISSEKQQEILENPFY